MNHQKMLKLSIPNDDYDEISYYDDDDNECNTDNFKNILKDQGI